MGIPRGSRLGKSYRVGAMQVSEAAPRAEALGKGQVTALNGLSPRQTSGRLSPVPPPRGAQPAAPEPRGRSRGSRPPAPCPLLSRTKTRATASGGKKGRAGEGGVTSGRSHSPRSGTFLGRGGRERGGEWGGGRERSADSPGCSARAGLPPARDPWPPPYAGACVGTCAGAPRVGRAPGRRQLRGDRFGVGLPCVSGGKQIPRRDLAHARAVGTAPERAWACGSSSVLPAAPLRCAFESRGSRHRLGGEKPCECHRMRPQSVSAEKIGNLFLGGFI